MYCLFHELFLTIDNHHALVVLINTLSCEVEAHVAAVGLVGSNAVDAGSRAVKSEEVLGRCTATDGQITLVSRNGAAYGCRAEADSAIVVGKNIDRLCLGH